MNPNSFIPFNLPSIGDEEINEVVAALRSGWLTTGPRTAQFEEEFRRYVGSASALAVNSATAGLHLALAGLEIGPGDEVITTPITFCSTINTILHVEQRRFWPMWEPTAISIRLQSLNASHLAPARLSRYILGAYLAIWRRSGLSRDATTCL